MSEDSGPPRDQTAGEAFIDSWQFNAVIHMSILLNAIQMGLQTENFGPEVDLAFDVFANIFTGIFACEMLVKLAVLKVQYFKDPWNVFDFVIAWLGILDAWIFPYVPGLEGDSILKIFQLLRLFRMVKLLRMKRELVALIIGLVGSLKCMMWIGVLLGVVLYAFGIFCVQTVGSTDYSSTKLDNAYYFGNLPRAMITLLNICLLDGWSTVIFSVWEVQPYLAPLFISFLVLTSFGLMNALIGVIVEQTTLATQQMDAETAEQERETKMCMVDALVRIVLSMDTNSDGCICASEMKDAEGVQDLQDLIRTINLPPGFGLTDLHMMLDQDGSGELDKEEFIQGMYRLVYCDNFQNQCISQLALAKVTNAVRGVRLELQRDVEGMLSEFREALQETMNSLVTNAQGFELHLDDTTFPISAQEGKATTEKKARPSRQGPFPGRAPVGEEGSSDSAGSPPRAGRGGASARPKAGLRKSSPRRDRGGHGGKEAQYESDGQGRPVYDRAETSSARPRRKIASTAVHARVDADAEADVGQSSRSSTSASARRPLAKVSEKGNQVLSSKKAWTAITPQAAAGEKATE